MDAGHDVVCLTLPGKHSGTFNAAWLAAEEFGDRVRVVDTGSFSLGMGLQVLEAARQALAGRSAEFIQRTAESFRARTSIIFVLDTLEWVRRGGRLDLIIPMIDRVARTLPRETHPGNEQRRIPAGRRHSLDAQCAATSGRGASFPVTG